MTLYERWLYYVTRTNQKRIGGRTGYMRLPHHPILALFNIHYWRKAKPVVLLHATKLVQVAWVLKRPFRDDERGW